MSKNLKRVLTWKLVGWGHGQQIAGAPVAVPLMRTGLLLPTRSAISFVWCRVPIDQSVRQAGHRGPATRLKKIKEENYFFIATRFY